MNRPLKPRPRAAKKPTREVLAAALAEKERALAEALARQAATAEVLRVISRSSADAQPVFESIALAAMRLLHCDVAGLFGCDESAYWTIAGANPEGLVTLPGPSRVRIDPAATFPSRAIVSKQVLHLPDWSRVELPDVERRVQEQAGLNSTLYLPMLREDRCVGLLVFGSTQPNNFGPGEIALAESFRDQASIAIENARLFNEAKAKTRDLEESLQQQTATADVLKVISRSVFDLQTVLDTLVESAYQLCGARMGLLYLAGDGAFECKAIAGAGVAEAEAMFKGRPIRAGRATAAERVIQTGEVESIEDFYADPDFSPKILAALQAGAAVGSPIGAFRSTLGAPMKRDDAVIGVIAIVRAETGPFPQRQVELLQTFADQAVIAIENARLFNEVQAKTHDLSEALVYQTGSANILKAIAASPTDVAPVLEAIVESACEVCNAYDAVVLLSDGEDLRAGAHRGPIPSSFDRIPISRTRVVGRAFLEQRPVHVPDYTLAAEEFPDGVELARRTGFRAILAVPLIREGESIGAIAVRRTEPYSFSDKQIALLQTFADQAVIAIGNVRLFDEVQARTHDLAEALQQQTATSDVLKVISRSAFDLQAVLDTLVESAVSLIDASSGVIWLREGDVFTVKAASSAEEQQAFFAQLRARPQRPGRSSIGARVLLTGEVQIVSDIKADPEYDPVIKAATNARTLLGVPLLRDGVIIGAFVLALHKLGTFTPRQIDLVKTFADQAVIAIGNTRLFEEVQTRTRDLTEALERQGASADILRVISGSPTDVKPVFEAIVLTAARLFDCNIAGVFRVEGDKLTVVTGAWSDRLFLEHEHSPPLPIDPAANFPSRAVVEKRTVFIADYSSSDAPEHERWVQKRFGVESGLYLPLMRGGECIGVFLLTASKVGVFGEKDIALAELFRDQAQIAIENTRLFSETQEALEQQTATAEVLKVISRSVFDLDAVLQTLVDTAVRLTRGSRGTIFIREGDVLSARAFHRNVPDELRRFLSTQTWRIDGDSHMAQAVRDGTVVHIPDLSQSEAEGDGETRKRAAYGAGLWAPLMRGGEAIGVFGVPREEPLAFSEREIDLVRTFADQAVIAIENARLFGEVQARTRDLEASLAQQTATADVLRIISRSVSDAAPVFETILESCQRLFGLHGVAIYLVEGDMVRGVARRGFDLGEWGDAMPLAGSSTGEAIAERRPLHIPDLGEKPGFPEGRKAALKEIGGMSVLYAPMLSQDRGVGSIVVTRRPKKPFTEAEIEFIQTFADQAVIAIENARLLEEVRARTSDLEESLAQQTATADVLKVISRSAFDLQPVLDTLIRSAVELVGSAHGSIHIREGDVFPQKSNFGFTLELSSRVRQAPQSPGRGTLTGRVALSGKVEAIADVLEDAEFTAPWKGVILVRSMLGVPLLRNDRVEGVLILARVEPGAFTPRQIELVQTFADQAEIAIENARLFEEVQAKTRDLSEALVYQTGSSNILKVIAASPTDVAPVLKAIVDSACEVCDAYDAAVVLKDGGDLKFSAHRGPIPIGLDKWPINRQWVGGRAFVDRQPVHVHDLTLAGEEFPDGRELARRMGHRTILAVPLVREGESIGAIIVRRNEAHSFTDKQIALLQTFADQAVIAIGNVRLFDEVQAKTRELSDSLEQQTAAAEILRVISSSPTDVQPVFEAIARSAAELCDATNSGVFLVRDGLIHLAGHHNLSDAQLASARHAFPAPLGRGIVSGRAILSRAVVHIPDIAADLEYSAESVVSAGFRCALSVPMLRNGEPIGAINVTRMEPRPFSNQQVELLKTFADQAVIAINNVGLFNETQEALQQQTATADVLKVISRSAFGLQTVLQTLVNSAVRLCAADGVIYLKHGDEFVAEAAFAADASGLARKRMPRRVGRDSVTGRVALSGQIEQIPDNLADPDFAVPTDQRMRMRSLLGVPLLRDGEVEGVFVLGRPEPGPFSERAVELVRTFADQAVIAIQNVRLFDAVQAKTRDLEESLQQQTATADVLKVISRSAFDLQVVFDTLIASAVELCGAFSGIICVREGDIYRYRGAAGEGDSAALTRYLLEHPATPGRGSLAGRVLLSGKVEAIPDRLEDPEFAVPMDAYGQVARSLLGVPLLGKAGIEGALLLTRKQPGRFTDRQVEIVQTFADQAVIAIENARLFDEVQARTRDLSEALQQQTATADVLKVISRSAFDLQTVLDTLVASASTLCEAEKGCIMQRRGDLYHWVSNFGFSDELVAYASSHPFREGGNSTTSRVARDRRTVHVPDVLADPDYTASEYQRLGGYRTMLGVPLLREGAPIGVFIMTREAVRPFNDRQIELLQTFADQAVIAIENVRLFDEVQARTRELAASLDDLRKAQGRLVQSEKLASLGQLTAGIAHEIKNPLNFINNFSALSRELLGELQEVLQKAPLESAQRDEATDLIDMLSSNLDKVVSHGKRANSIVKNMLLHSREGSGECSSVNVNAMVEEALNLAYHGARAERPGFNVTIVKSLDPAAGAADLYVQEMTRVLLNLISNGFYATTKRKQSETDHGYEPTITASTRDLGDSVEIAIRDNGTGIAEEVKAKMFNPFFTTKPAGEGTGLGLSLSHDIVAKQHGGTLEVSTEPGAYTQFTIVVPRAAQGASEKAGAAR